MLQDLNREERLQLMRFICSFAWADLEVRAKERAFIKSMVKKLDLSPDEAKEIQKWLEVPPPAELVDPTRIPRAHRELFLKTARQIIASDGEIDPEEQENLALLEALTR
jgi:tellurite resistance protein